MSRVRTYGAALAGRRSEIEKPRGFRTAPGGVVWRRTERDLEVVEDVSVVFSNVEVRVKHGGPSALGLHGLGIWR